MANTVVNLTLTKVLGEFDNILATYPAQIHLKISSNPELRTKLLNYVIRHITEPQVVLIDSKTPSSISPKFLYCSTLEQLEIEEMMQKGISYLITE